VWAMVWGDALDTDHSMGGLTMDMPGQSHV
jgi:hypothetical protein